MATLTEIKKVLYKEKPIAKQIAIYRDGSSKDYEADTSLGKILFHVPFIEQRNAEGILLPEFKENKDIEAQLLIRWIKI